MQIHPPSAHVVDGEFPVHLHPRGDFAVIEVDPDAGRRGTRLFMESVSDCDRLIAAAAWARSLLLAGTSEPVEEHDPTGAGDEDDDAGDLWCSSATPGDWNGGVWQCTLAAGHEGRHEARGVLPLPFWEDGDTHAEYDETAGTDAS